MSPLAKSHTYLTPVSLGVAILMTLQCTPSSTQVQHPASVGAGNEQTLTAPVHIETDSQARVDSDASTAVQPLQDASVAMAQFATQPPADSGVILTEELTAYEAARPVFQRYCASCHTASGQLWRVSNTSHFDMSRYPFGGHHASTITATIRRVLGATGQRATMPPSRSSTPAVRGAELQLVLAWADAVDRAAAPTAVTHDHHHH